MKGTWDLLDFETRQKLKARYGVEVCNFSGQRTPLFLAVLIAQVANAARASEAFDAVKAWTGDAHHVRYVRARKKGRQGPIVRSMS